VKDSSLRARNDIYAICHPEFFDEDSEDKLIEGFWATDHTKKVEKITMKRMRNALYAIAFLLMFVVDAAMGAQPGAWKADWDKTVEAAKKEGQLVIYGSPDFETLYAELHKKYPEIKITGVFNRGADVAKRLMAPNGAGKNI